LICSAGASAEGPSSKRIFSEHHRNPQSRIVQTSYVCPDGRRSIIVRYDDVPRARVVRLVRNGVPAPSSVVRQVNGLLAYLDSLTGLYPQCGSNDDTFSASGRKDKAHAAILIHWSLTKAALGQILE
jgi:hypothetical protein